MRYLITKFKEMKIVGYNISGKDQKSRILHDIQHGVKLLTQVLTICFLSDFVIQLHDKI